MIVNWPWWYCPNPSCQARLVPADIHAACEPSPSADRVKELRLDSAPQSAIPQPNAPGIAQPRPQEAPQVDAPPRETAQPHKP
jgi:hypothetical protein